MDNLEREIHLKVTEVHLQSLTKEELIKLNILQYPKLLKAKDSLTLLVTSLKELRDKIKQ